MTGPAPTVERAVAAMRERRALLVGDVVLDTYLYGETVRVSREAPVLVVRKERVEHRLGGAANAAANLAALGVTTEMVSVVGADRAGERLREMLARVGVEVSQVSVLATTTQQKTRVLAGAFGTARQQVLRIDDEPWRPLEVEHGAAMAGEIERRAAHADVVIASDYGGGVVGTPVIEALRRIAASGVPVCVDSRHRLAEFGGVTVVKPNVPEAAALAGFPLDSQAAVQRAGELLLRRLGCDASLITQGRSGMTLFRHGHEPLHVEVVGSREVTDVTGAGDTVTATLSAAMAAGLGLANGMRLANCAAGVVVMKVGAATASADEIVEAARRGGVGLEPWDA